MTQIKTRLLTILLNLLKICADTSSPFLPLPHDYNKSFRPGYWDGESTDVQTGLQLISFGPVDEKNSRVTTEIYLRFLWREPDLAG